MKIFILNMNRQKPFWFWLICAGLTLLPITVLGGRYVPLMDDYIMYQGYHLYDPSYLLGTVRIWTARPVANLLDLFLWSRFHNNLFFLFFLFALFRLTAVYFLTRFFDEQGFEGATMPLCILLLWCPLGIEATGWLAASSRIVMGLFFMGIALWCLIHNKWGWFGLFLLLSYGCYEQIALVGCCLSLYDIWHRNKKFLWIPVVGGIVLAAYYLICSRWSTTPRGDLNVYQSVSTLQNIWEGWRLGLSVLLPQSIRRGLLYFQQQVWLAPILIVLTGLLVWVWQPRRSRNNSRWLGLVLFAVCFLPFFVLQENGITFRTLYLPMIGISLFLLGGGGLNRKWVCFILILLFSVGTVGEFRDYQQAGQKDLALLTQLAQEITNDQITVPDLGVYHEESSVQFGQHIASVTSTEWSLTAGLRAVTKNTKVTAIIKK